MPGSKGDGADGVTQHHIGVVSNPSPLLGHRVAVIDRGSHARHGNRSIAAA